MTKPEPFAVAAVFAALGLLAACGGSSDRALLGGADISVDPSSISPIEDFFGYDFNDPDALRAEQMRVEIDAGLIAQRCMLEQGFEFTPPPSVGQSATGPTGQDLERGSDEWIGKYGFGVTTLHFPESMVGALVGIPEAEAPITDEYVDELNRDYTDALTQAERDAYYLALNGEAGCTRKALAHIRAEAPNARELFNTFRDELEEMQKRTDADPRVVEFYAEVSACVADTGLKFDNFNHAASTLLAALNEVQQSIERDDNGSQRLNPTGLERLAELQAEELATAQAVLQCGGGPDETETAIGAVMADYQREFLRENADRLAEFRPEE